MSDLSNKFSPDDQIGQGIATVSTDDWIKLTTFFDSAIYANPRTEEEMRTSIEMHKDDEFRPEFRETTELFDKLGMLGEEFERDVVEEVLGLADDIVHYQTQTDVVYQRLGALIDKYDFDGADGIQDKLDALLALWGEGRIDGRSEKIKDRFLSALNSLISEAEVRADRAEKLQQTILGDGGMAPRIRKIKSAFDKKQTEFDSKFGDGGTELARLKALKDSVDAELAALQKKEKDEVIVLSTSPVYLVIPMFGPFILAGVDIGVGIDLAKVREKISTLQKEITAYRKKINTTERFQGYYTNGKEIVGDIAEKIEKVAPKLEAVGKGWRAMAKDLDYIVQSLSDHGRSQIAAEDWFNFVNTLDTSRNTWKRVAGMANHFRLVAEPVAAKTPEELTRKATTKAAA